MINSIFKTLNRAVIGLLVAISVSSTAEAAEKKAAGFQLPSVNKLVEYFDDVVFGSEFDPKLKAKVVTKRVDKITISLQGRPSKAVVAALQKHIKAVLPLTGLGAKTVKKGANLQIVFLPKGGKINIGSKSIIVSGPGCSFFSQAKAGKTYLTQIIVNNVGGDAQISHCLLEEFTQSLGLPNDSDKLRPSIFSDKDKLQSLSLSDKILVSTLYHPRMLPGMSRKVALLVAREIIRDYRKGMMLLARSMNRR